MFSIRKFNTYNNYEWKIYKRGVLFSELDKINDLLEGSNKMGTYRKLPVEIQAFRLGYDDIPGWFRESKRVCTFIQERRIDGNVYCDLRTLEGTMRANKGDYIIQGVQGEVYPCREDIFNSTYEKVK